MWTVYAWVMIINALHLVQLVMPRHGEVEAVAFYEGVLGVPQQQKASRLADRGGCWFEDGDVRIHIGVEDDFRPAKKAHPALLTDDLAGLVAHIEAHDISITSDQPLPG